MNAPCSFALIFLTCAASWFGFRSRVFEAKYIFNPQAILGGKEYHRLVTPAFLHSGWNHLLLNMVTLYCFGPLLEWALGAAQFLLIYFGAILGGSLLSLLIHRHHIYFAYGASGGVCGLIYAFILLFPGAGVSLFFAVPVPGWLYAIGFIIWSFFAMKAGRDNIGHDAHLGGAMVGFLIAAGLHPDSVRNNWVVFLLVLVPTVGLLCYVWFNPLFLPLKNYLSRNLQARTRPSAPSRNRQEVRQLDEILDKVSREGIHSLTKLEQEFLNRVSAKYQSRGVSKKPESDLII
jgi:membrane associated rhomboid family serine protease